MDITSGAPFCNTAAEPVASTFEDLPIAAFPSMLLHVLTNCDLAPQDLAKLEKTCTLFRHPARFAPNEELSIAEVAALDLCEKRTTFRPMTSDQCEELKRKCGGSWKLVFKYLQAGELCCRRGKPHAVAGPGHSIVVTAKGAVYSFGSAKFGQLGLGNTQESLQGIRIVQAAVGNAKTMLVSDTGRLYAFGHESFGYSDDELEASLAVAPKLVESVKDIFVVQAAIGNFFTAVLSREGRVYTFWWGSDKRLGHKSDSSVVQPSPLLGELENRHVVQIAAGYCYLLALACEPSGMSVYSVGCGLGGKLGHGSTSDEEYPRLIQEFRNLKMQPMIVSASAWHAAVVGKDGRVCTWGWGHLGCLGHGDKKFVSVPKVVQRLRDVKAANVATGTYTTTVISEDGNVYTSGLHREPLDPDNEDPESEERMALEPKHMKWPGHAKDRVVHINTTESASTHQHAFALTESGKLYAFGAGDTGQLGVKLEGDEIWKPKLVGIDLN